MGLGSGIPINNIGVFGNGWGQLPESNAAFRYDDLAENAMFIQDGNNDGIFNGNDYLLFYGRGPERWSYIQSEDSFAHHKHHYTDKNYYFVTSDAGNGKQLSSVGYNPPSANKVIDQFDDFKFIEEDITNLIGTGRKWYGDLFDFKQDYNYSFNFPNLVDSVPVDVYTVAVARSLVAGTRMDVNSGNTKISVIPFGAVSSGSGDDYVRQSASRDEFLANSSNITLTCIYNNSANPSAIAWLDYIEVRARRELKMTGSSMFFRSVENMDPGNVNEYQIEGLNANDRIWDVTEHINPQTVSFFIKRECGKFQGTRRFTSRICGG